MTPRDVESERAHMERLCAACRETANQTKRQALQAGFDEDGELERLINEVERRKSRMLRHLEALRDQPADRLVHVWPHLKAEGEHVVQELQVAVSELEACAVRPHGTRAAGLAGVRPTGVTADGTA